MLLYANPKSLTTRQICTVLAEKGAVAKIIAFDVELRTHKQAAHLARHPFGYLPVLEDDEFCLFETHAILRYLDDKLADPRLSPMGVRERALMDQWLSCEQAYLLPAMKKIFACKYAKMMGLEEPGPNVIEEGKSETAHVLGVVSERLSTNEYLIGNQFSLADLCWLTDISYLVDTEMGELVLQRPNIYAWWSRFASRPSWLKALTDLSIEALTAPGP